MFCTISGGGGGGAFAKPPPQDVKPVTAAAPLTTTRKTSRSIMKASASTEGTLDTSGAELASGATTPAKKHRKQSSYKRSLSLNAKLHNNVKASSGSFADIALANYHSCEFIHTKFLLRAEQ